MTGDHDKLSAWLSYASALLIGVVLCLIVFPAGFVLPSAPMARALEGDFAQHVVGQRYFVADAWRWPLLQAGNLNAPDGVSIAFTDSLPLMSLVLKAFSFALPPGFHGFGVWYVLAWVLQPVAAVWCLRMAGERRLLPAVAIAVVAVSMPAWWSRFSHASLCGHFLIWIAIGLYFVLTREGGVRHWALAALLQVAALLVHPYLWAMTSAVLLAAPVTLLVNGDRRWRGALAGLAVALAVPGALAVALGYVGAHGGWGFGHFAMNLLSPVWPAGSSLLPWELPRIQATEFSAWEGYNYLGAGILLGFVALLLVKRGNLFAGLSRHSGLVVAAALLFVYALSNRVGVGSHLLGEIYPDDMLWGALKPFFDAFRSSGRMFWPVGYLLALGLVIAAARVNPRWLATGLLIGIAGLQFVDNRHLRASVAHQVRTNGQEWIVDAPALRAQFAEAGHLNIYPRWECTSGGDETEPTHKVILQLLTLASETALPVNTMYVARWKRMRPCEDEREASQPLAPGEARVFTPFGVQRYGALVPDAASLCRPLGDLLVCVRPRE